MTVLVKEFGSWFKHSTLSIIRKYLLTKFEAYMLNSDRCMIQTKFNTEKVSKGH